MEDPPPRTVDIAISLAQLALAVVLTYMYGAFGFGIAAAVGNVWNIAQRAFFPKKEAIQPPLVFTAVWNAILAASALLLTYNLKWTGLAIHLFLVVVGSFLLLPFLIVFAVGKTVENTVNKAKRA